MEVVICGGGIIGTCTAYFLLKHNIKCTVVEQTNVACAASGKAGGFLARDWCKSDGALHELAKTSFDLHQHLAQELGGAELYDYRRLDAFSASVEHSPSRGSLNKNVKWANGTNVDQKSVHCIGTTETVAQLHPYKFTKALFEHSKSNGVRLIEGDTVCGLSLDKNKVVGVKLKSGTTVNCDAVVLCMGPWTGLASKWVPNLPSVYGQKAHSITVLPQTPIPAQALFTDYGKYSPELYPRPDGEVYVCGMAENPVPSNQLPSCAENVQPTRNSCEKIKEMTNLVGDSLLQGQVTKSQSCYLPLTQDGLPLVGKLKDSNNIYIGAGHGCWGILNAPATGKALAELIATGSSSLNINAFDPSRFP